MTTFARSLLTGVMLTLIVPAGTQQNEASDREREKPLLYVPISLATVENLIERGTDDWARSFDFDDEQLETMRRIVKDTFIPFLRKNRGTLGDLLSEFIEVQTGVESPDVDGVAEWAERALPVLNRFKDMLDDTTDQMREHMTEDQQFSLDAQHAAMQAGFTMVRRKIAGWADGGFDPETEWYPDHPRPGDPSDPPIEPVEVSDPKPAAPASQPAPSDDSNDEWTRYVVDFIERYDLGPNQRQDARRQLRKHHDERDAYLTRPRTVNDIARAAKLVQEAETEQEEAEAQRQLDRLDQRAEERIAAIFQHLKDTLEKIPTRKQRDDAKKKELDRRPAAEEGNKQERDERKKKEDPGSP
ncbi:MAG: hypothetical protein IID33_00240 [Planctomycetes bacterium]|nr:hypothetical protein [Planctomycetota bacterium]